MSSDPTFDEATGKVTLPQPVPKVKKGRQDAKYFTPIELSIILPFKPEFQQIYGHDKKARHRCLQDRIFPPLMRYWFKQDDPSIRQRTQQPDIIEWTRKIGDYVTNNWRSKVSLHKLPRKRITYTNFMYSHNHRAVVNQLLAMLPEGEELNALFVRNNRHKAAKAIYNSMTEDDKEKFNRELEKAKQNGYSPEMQERAWKHHGLQHVEYAQKKLFLDLGVASLQIVGNLNAETPRMIFTDNIASSLGLKGAKKFGDVMGDRGKAFLKLVHEYIVDIRRIVRQRGASASAAASGSKDLLPSICYDGSVQLDNQGFPLLPVPWPGNLEAGILRKYWHEYLSAHYKLAKRSGSDNPKVDFKAMSRNLSDYIDSKYLPPIPNFKFASYQSMPTQMLASFFEHVSDRQVKHGAADAFRFSHVYASAINPRKKAYYPDTQIDSTLQLGPPAEPESVGDQNQFTNLEVQRKAKRGKKKTTAPQAFTEVGKATSVNPPDTTTTNKSNNVPHPSNDDPADRPKPRPKKRGNKAGKGQPGPLDRQPEPNVSGPGTIQTADTGTPDPITTQPAVISDNMLNAHTQVQSMSHNKKKAKIEDEMEDKSTTSVEEPVLQSDGAVSDTEGSADEAAKILQVSDEALSDHSLPTVFQPFPTPNSSVPPEDIAQNVIVSAENVTQEQPIRRSTRVRKTKTADTLTPKQKRHNPLTPPGT
ncbi:hypothetical protein CVT24_002520 [Panaeolus cyanescens]|uniref:Uncharacterized protein n=1 Tax=Panaeolus cyanescens TaxID=181874 RepID=A0A409YTI9_9AGAR|nr:hypothetical protein CVT24_002520 [Panaeolus cyanescens]